MSLQEYEEHRKEIDVKLSEIESLERQISEILKENEEIITQIRDDT